MGVLSDFLFRVIPQSLVRVGVLSDFLFRVIPQSLVRVGVLSAPCFLSDPPKLVLGAGSERLVFSERSPKAGFWFDVGFF